VQLILPVTNPPNFRQISDRRINSVDLKNANEKKLPVRSPSYGFFD